MTITRIVLCREAASMHAPAEPGLVSGLRGLAGGVTAGVTGIVRAPAAGVHLSVRHPNACTSQ